jgi:hydrogenase/urease accessory protein HupE
LAVALIAAVPAFGHVTGVEHPAGPFHPILGVDHVLIFLAIAAVVGLFVAWRR